jgi:hypothetical protein
MWPGRKAGLRRMVNKSTREQQKQGLSGPAALRKIGSFHSQMVRFEQYRKTLT